MSEDNKELRERIAKMKSSGKINAAELKVADYKKLESSKDNHLFVAKPKLVKFAGAKLIATGSITRANNNQASKVAVMTEQSFTSSKGRDNS